LAVGCWITQPTGVGKKKAAAELSGSYRITRHVCGSPISLHSNLRHQRIDSRSCPAPPDNVSGAVSPFFTRTRIPPNYDERLGQALLLIGLCTPGHRLGWERSGMSLNRVEIETGRGLLRVRLVYAR